MKILIFLLLVPLSCSLIESEADYTLKLPPPADPSCSYRQVVSLTNNQGQTFKYELPDVKIKLTLNTRSVVLVQTYESLGEGHVIPLVPAGDFNYPERLQINYRNGFLAAVCQTLAESGFPIKRFNFERLRLEIDPWTNPWVLDRECIIGKILAGTFRKTDIKPLPTREIKIFLSQGNWYFNNPLIDPLCLSQDEELNCELSLGIHYLLNLQLRRYLIVYLYPDDCIILDKSY